MIPLKSWFTVFNAISSTTAVANRTKRIPPLGSEFPEWANSIILEVVGASTPSWTLDIQGRVHPDDTYTAIDYVQIWQAGAAALANAQLSITDTTRRYYLLPNVPPFVQLVATLTTGTLTVRGCYTSEIFAQWLLTTARGSIYIEGPTASDAVEAGNPVQIGGSVDDITPVAAGEGRVRRVRVTPEGNLIAELYRDNISACPLDDAAWTVATNPVFPIGALADDISPDSVDEGDVGAVAMTLARELYVRPMRRGASEILTKRGQTGSTTRATLLTPTAGKRVRIVSYSTYTLEATDHAFEMYFGTGANITTTAGKEIDEYAANSRTTFNRQWADGAGPLGAVDDVVSFRTSAALASGDVIILVYREE